MTDKIKVKSVYKAVKVLECFCEKQPMSITEISEKLGLYKSNVFDILSTFVAMNYVIQDEESSKYYLGPNVVKLGKSAEQRNNLPNIAAPIMNRLAAETGEIVYLTIPLGYQVFYLNTIFPSSASAAVSPGIFVNSSEAMHLTSGGKAMLSRMPESFIDDYLAMPLSAGTEFSITDPDKLRAELVSVRQQGYAVDEQENSIGLRCVGVPIVKNSKQVVGALSISGPITHFTRDKIPDYSQRLKAGVAEIASNL